MTHDPSSRNETPGKMVGSKTHNKHDNDKPQEHQRTGEAHLPHDAMEEDMHKGPHTTHHLKHQKSNSDATVDTQEVDADDDIR